MAHWPLAIYQQRMSLTLQVSHSRRSRLRRERTNILHTGRDWSVFLVGMCCVLDDTRFQMISVRSRIHHLVDTTQILAQTSMMKVQSLSIRLLTSYSNSLMNL